MREWLENQLQNEYRTKLRVEGAISALEAMIKKLDDDGQQAATAEQPEIAGSTDVPQPDASARPAVEPIDFDPFTTIEFPTDHD